MSLQEARRTLQKACAACTGCGSCASRCEVLADAQHSVGDIAGAFLSAFDGQDAALAPDAAAEVLRRLALRAQEAPDLVFAVRRCCMCASCTVGCPADVDARDVFTALRELLTLAGVVGGEGFESTQVDRDWHIFSVYRAVYGISFVDLPSLDDARERGADTLFFPGCPLASYAPDLARAAFSWLEEQGMRVVFSDACCGSPLKAAGRADRARAHREGLVARMHEAGIERIVCVCPGCADELAQASNLGDLRIMPLPRLLSDAGVTVDGATLRERIGVRAYVEAPVRVAAFDSCHDRDGAFGAPLRALFADEVVVELPQRGEQARCCGASGAVVLVDPDLSARRARRALDEPDEDAVDLLVANCPTCSYTFAAQQRADVAAGIAVSGVPHASYLELVFGIPFEWEAVFERLEGMWTGEYGAWVCQQLL
ncbi:(Fe-S)-binding protein [Eggerthella sinensis]|uniref:(Fe-S)-binding protein n=1 Tax=Eggerthella sinensis TaxID=242230 RepID=UPI001D08462C|nr:(Fe-S)-binding protein [Eggerthella sinensis]MCB7037421.1 (Fe-S)-binding protein [Eggerthella sinensis]